MMDWIEHLVIAPVLLPLVAAASMLLFDERRRQAKRALSLVTSAALIAISLTLLAGTWADHGAAPLPQVYLLGDWAAPFGIVLVADRLSALMLVLTNFLGFSCLIYASARWDRSGPRFHALFLLLLMGVNGAFLTGDIFNLFVFFEVLLAASYGLALHGGGRARTSAGLHYISINVATSLLFLIGVSVIYALTGTLNLAHLATLMGTVPADDLAVLRSGMAVLGIAFLVKAGMWPLGFWLPSTYGAASPPAAAMFAILTKVGVYIVLRFTMLLFPGQELFAAAAGAWLETVGMATMAFGIVALLASQTLSRLAGCYLLISSGTVMAAIGFGGAEMIAGMLFYLLSSTLAVGALYLIIEPVERNTASDAAQPASEPTFEDQYLDNEEMETEIGVAIPASIAFLGAGFIVIALLLSGLPPLPTFLAKFALIDGLLNHPRGIQDWSWAMIALLAFSGLAALMTISRAGIELLWTPSDRPSPNLNVIEAAPIGLLLASCIAMAVWAGPVMTFLEMTTQQLLEPSSYIRAVGDHAPVGERSR